MSGPNAACNGAPAAQISENNNPHSWNAATGKQKTPFILVRLILLLRPGRGVSSYGGASPGPAYPPRQLNVLLHDGDPLGVDGAQVDVLEEVDEEGLGGLLQGLDRLRLPPELLADRSEVDCDLANL